MSDLRVRCLTAMTEAMVDEDPDRPLDDYAVACLDALLEVLEEQTANWQMSVNPLAAGEVAALLEVLKPTTEEARE